ncbi:MAG: DMT family transporter [Thermoflexaceae bacterium]|nr:DMT family transporter [Thermoflexaceae bacterium]
MDFAISLSITVVLGLFATYQAALTGAISRERGGMEASIISPLGSLAIIAVLLAWIAVDEGETKLPFPFDSAWAVAAAVAITWLALWLAVRGLPPWYATTGFSAGLGLALTPRLIGDLGLALYFSATTFGGCLGALGFDHTGAFGAARRAVSVSRVGGLALVGVGLVLVRAA